MSIIYESFDNKIDHICVRMNNYDLIDFNPLSIEESEEMTIKEYEQKIIKENSNNYISNDTKYNDPIGFIDDSYQPDDIKSYSRVKDECIKDKDFYNNILSYAKEESPRTYILLKDFKQVFLKRLGIYEYPS